MNADGSNLIQLTASDGDSLSPQLSDDGSLVVFTSDGDLSQGLNTDGSFEIFVARTDGSSITQISDGTVDTGGGFFSIDAAGFSISGDGAYVAFTSTADFTGDNPDLDPTIFWAGTGGGAVTQLLRPGTVSDSDPRRNAQIPSLNNDGSTVSFVSFINYTSVTQPGRDKIYTIARQ
jgi:Tol biopolymer transport system component